MNFKQRLITGILIISALAACTPVLLAQKSNANPDRVLVGGEYPLKQSDVDQLGEFFEWLFDTRLTAAQHEKFVRLLVKKRQTSKRTVRTLTSLPGNYPKFKALSEEKREQFRQQLLPELIAELEKSNDETDLFLLSIYRNAQAENNPDNNTQTDDPQNDDSNTVGGNVGLQ